MSATPMVIAHRTCPRDAPENSIRGVLRAAELGADAVEIDARLARDGIPVLLHDRTLRRTTGRWGPPWLWSSTSVTALGIGDGERVPTFAAALAALPPGLMVAIDVKSSRAVRPLLGEITNQHAEARVMVWSQHPAVVRFATARHPDIEASLLRDTWTRRGHRAFVRAAVRCGARGISARWAAVTPEFAELVRSRGLRLYSWCRAPDPSTATLALVDGIVTDWPAAARAIVDGLPAV
jgi:glycerophosphoryl diester phosphodiesterase